MSDRIAVLGLGLIGGSLSLRLASAYDVVGYDVVGYDADGATRELARSAGLIIADDLPGAIDGASVVVVAVPLPALSAVVAQAAGLLSPDAVVTDVGSVKGPVYADVRAAGPMARFVGGHPMAGTERSGFAAGDPGLFDGAAWVLCLEPDTELSAWLRVARVLTAIDARVVPSTAADHDAAVARVSHVPHLLAAALAATVAEAGPLALTLAAGSFRDGTRVAATAPALPTAMCRANRDAVAGALAETIHRLRAAEDDPTALLAAGHRGRLAYDTRQVGPAEIQLADPGIITRLLDLGRRGGWVERIGSRTLQVVVPGPV